MKTDNITPTNNLIKAAAAYVGEQIGLKQRPANKMKEPWWKRRIEGDIRTIRKDLNVLVRFMRNDVTRKTGKYSSLERKYNLKAKGVREVIEELKQRLKVKSAKIRRYENRINQYRQNRMGKSQVKE